MRTRAGIISIDGTLLPFRRTASSTTRTLSGRRWISAMRPSITRRDLESRIDRLIEELAARHANLGVTSGRQAVEEAAEPLETRGIVVFDRGHFRVRERSVLRYYARSIEHLLVTTGRTH